MQGRCRNIMDSKIEISRKQFFKIKMFLHILANTEIFEAEIVIKFLALDRNNA